MYKLILPHQFPDAPIRAISSDFSKVASYTCSEIADFIKKAFKPAEGKTYLLVNALGSGEYWGSNVNGDFFPEKSLMNKGASYGYKTFEHYAHVYEHHVNKDPAKALGRVKCAAYNPEMHRVELLLEIDNTKGKDLVEKVAAGEYPDWSMGCKVPYDVCSCCGKQAKKVAEYCDHLKLGMNKIAEITGRRNYAINTMPKFFDISRVVIGADKTAKMLKKVASAGTVYSSALMGLSYYGEDNEEKTAEPKSAMEKEIPVEASTVSPAMANAVRTLEEYDPELSKPVLKKLSSFPLEEVFSTLGYSGIVLTPREFQTLVLTKTGREKVAAELDSRGVVFPLSRMDEITDEIDVSVDRGMIAPGHVKEAVFNVVSAFLPHRSILENYVHDRLERIAALPAGRLTKQARAVDMPWVKTAGTSLLELLATLGLSYALYRHSLPSEASEFESLMKEKPWMAPVVVGGAVGGIQAGQALVGPSVRSEAQDDLDGARVKVGKVLSWKTLGSVIGPVGLAYLTAASARRKELEGEELGPIEKGVKNYPGPLGVLGAYGLLKARSALAKVK